MRLPCGHMAAGSAIANAKISVSRKSRVIVSPLSVVSVRNHDDCPKIRGEHQSEIRPSLAVCAAEFLPHRHSPKRGDHRRRLADGIGDRYPCKSSRDKIEAGAESPCHAAKNTEQMVLRARFPKAGERNRFAEQRKSHQYG